MALSEDDYRRIADSTEIKAEGRSGGHGGPNLSKGAIALLAIGGLGALWFLTQDNTPTRRLTDPDTEQFSSTRPVTPIVPPEQVEQKTDNDRVVVETKEEVTPPPPLVTPAVPQEADALPEMEEPAPAVSVPVVLGNEPAPVDNSAAEKARWERLRSDMIVMNDGQADASNRNQQIDNGVGQGSAVTADVESNANVSFLNQQAQEGVTVATAGKIDRTDAYIVEGTMIRGVLETAIQSDLPGSVRAVVSEDVWSFDGRRILVPRGSRLIGQYNSAIAQGQTRVLIAWNRVIRSDGVTVQLGSIGTDALGRSGMPGKVDRKILQRYGGALLLTLIGGGAQYLAGLGQEDSQPSQTISQVDPITGQVTTTTVNGNSSQNEAREIAARTISQSIQEMANAALQNSMSIPPTIHINQGERIMIFVRRDLDFSALYEDPVREKMRELRNRHVYK